MKVEDIIAALRRVLYRALIALDFDGTLAPIVADPQRSRPVPGTLQALVALRDAGAQLAVITGRDAETAVRLGRFDAVPGLEVFGLYGLESWRDGRLSTIDEPAAVGALREQLPAVLASAVTDPAVWIEDKRLSLVVHARRAADPVAQLALAREPVSRLARSLGLQTHDGRDVLEIRLPGFDKASTLRRLVDDTDPAAVLFAGDDTGDLPAFAAVRSLREAGRVAYAVGVRSAQAPEVVAAADATVDSPQAMVAMLTAIAAPEGRSASPLVS